MTKKLNILIVEDVPADVVLINQELHKGGLEFRSKHVDNEDDFLRELQHHPPDLILSDHGLPSFDGFTALSIARHECPDTPFMFVSGSPSLQAAIETLKCGAAAYVLKDRLSTGLVPAVRRVLQESVQRRRDHAAEIEREHHAKEVEATLAKFKALSHSVPICPACKRKIRDAHGAWHALEAFLLTHSDSIQAHDVCPECARGKQPHGE